MAKIATSVRLEEDLIKRLDAVAEARGESRSELIERVLQNQVVDEEKLIKELDNPVMRLMIRTLMNNPAIVKTIAKMAGRKINDEGIEIGRRRADKAIERAKERQAAKKGKSKTNTDLATE